MSGRYARDTDVSVSKSQGEIQDLLRRYGADQFLSGWDDEAGIALIGFRMRGRQVKFRLVMPKREEFRYTPSQGYERSPENISKAHEQAMRQRWRALKLVIQAKLEAVEVGITDFESEFLANIVLSDGRTYGEFAIPQIDAMYERGGMPALLPGLSDTRALGDGR